MRDSSTLPEKGDALALLQWQIARQLQALLQRNAAGGDIAIGERMRLEGWMEAALLVAAGRSSALIADWQRQLPAATQLQCQSVDDGWQVRLDIWQARAPVVPSTRD